MRDDWRVDREARAHFQVIRLRRWPVVLLAALVLGAAALPWGRLAESLPSLGNQQVASGVQFLHQDLTGRTAAQLRPWLQSIAGRLHMQRGDAAPVMNQVSGEEGVVTVPSVIPAVNGYQLDVEATVRQLLRARAGQQVEPVLQVEQPTRSLADFPHRAITRGNAQKQQVALLINVDWGEEQIPTLLQALDKSQVKATFFVSGRWAQRFPNLLKQIAASGHEIGSHGNNLQQDPVQLSARGQLRTDIEESVKRIQGATGQSVHYWAPHKGAVNQQVIDTAADLGYRTVLWSLDTVDWKDSPPADLISQRVLSKIQPGDLVLMHPLPNTVAALPQILAGLRTKGLHPVTLSQILSPERPETQGVSTPVPAPPIPSAPADGPIDQPTLAPTAQRP